MTKIQCPFMIKSLRKLGIKGNFINLIKDIYIKLHLTSYLIVEV